MPPKITSTLSCCDELGRLGFRDAVDGGAVLEAEFDLPSQQAAAGVDVVDDHFGDVGIGDTHERQRAGLVRDHSHLDGCFFHGFSSGCRGPTGPVHAWRMSAASRLHIGRIPYTADLPWSYCTRPRSRA